MVLRSARHRAMASPGFKIVTKSHPN
jgi:hypothetical protein